MNWSEQYPKTAVPAPAQIDAYIGSPLWEALCSHLETTYSVSPVVEHSICSGAPGWNVKYKKSGRSLCTLYPAKGYFTAMVTVGRREEMAAELLLRACTDYLQQLYTAANGVNGARWLMIEVRTPEILRDTQRLIDLRVQKL